MERFETKCIPWFLVIELAIYPALIPWPMAYRNPILNHAIHARIIYPASYFKHLMNTTQVNVVFLAASASNLRIVSYLTKT